MKKSLGWHYIWNKISFWKQARCSWMWRWSSRSRKIQRGRRRRAGQRCLIGWTEGGKINHLPLFKHNVWMPVSTGELDWCRGCTPVQEASCFFLSSPDFFGFLSARPLLLQLHSRFYWIAAHSFSKPLHCNDWIYREFWTCWKTSSEFL